jgi:hypothetical protein
MIDLEVPISGNVNDPEFNFNPAIGKAIANILTNIVAAPFRLPGNLIGGGADEGSLEQIRFLPGRSDVATPKPAPQTQNVGSATVGIQQETPEQLDTLSNIADLRGRKY